MVTVIRRGDAREVRWLVRMPELPAGAQRCTWLLELQEELGRCVLLALMAPMSEGPGICIHSLSNDLGALAEFHHTLPAFSLTLPGIGAVGSRFEFVATNNTGKAVTDAVAYVRTR